jgi:uncharacterized protein (TIGR02646 family)
LRYLRRPVLTQHAQRLLQRRTGFIASSSHPVAEASRRWRNARATADHEIRRKLREMVGRMNRCMYCEDSEGVDVDHFWPKAQFPLRTFAWENLLLACSNCNSTYKRNSFPLSTKGVPLLIDPTSESPTRHLDYSPSTGQLHGRTAKGHSTIAELSLNRPSLTTARRTLTQAAIALILDYDQLQNAGRLDDADRVRRCLRRLPHSSMVDWICAIARSQGGTLLLPSRVVSVLVSRPELP